jgi:hypothetical protein
MIPGVEGPGTHIPYRIALRATYNRLCEYVIVIWCEAVKRKHGLPLCDEIGLHHASTSP